MTYTITNECIACESCVTRCPTGAIEKTNATFSINPNLCNDCVGYYGVPECVAGCPTDAGCVPTISSLIDRARGIKTDDYWDNWFSTYNNLVSRLKARKHTKYWQHWFDTYSQKLDILIHP